ncbi:MAG: hypothetical protein PHO00_07675, partial [bacterium]|nr:hypothetical protein [bacterium]
EEIINTMVLEEREVTNNIPGVSADEAVSFTVYYAPGDALGRERFKVMGGRIEIPFEWIRGKPLVSKALSFNLSGQLLSMRKILDPARADTVFNDVDMDNMGRLGITPDTLLPGSVELNYRVVTDPVGNLVPTDIISHINVSYLMPEDILSRELAVIKYNVIGERGGMGIERDMERTRNWLGQEVLIEKWKDEKGSDRKKVIGKRKETVINEWYNEAKKIPDIIESLIGKLTGGALRAAGIARAKWPKTFEELEALVKEDKIRERYFSASLPEIKKSLQNVREAPAGVLPGLHIIKGDNSLGEIRYFADICEYPRGVFGHKGVSVPYDEEIKPFSLPEGTPILGLKYGILNSDEFIYDVHTLNGQLVIRVRPYVQIRLVNMFPIASGEEQIEYYDPFVPHPYLRPIKIEKNFEPGRQPAGERPGMLVIAVFPDDSTVYLENGWKAQTFMERRPLDINRWIKSVNYYVENEDLKYKKEHIEKKSIYTFKKIGWKTPVFFGGLVFFAVWLLGFREHLKMLKNRDERLCVTQNSAKNRHD